MRHLLTLIVSLVSLSGCTTYYQLAYVKSKTVPYQGSNLAYQNDTVGVSYDFWSEGGVVSFDVYNKTTAPIYVDWKKSSFIVKGRKYDYWVDQSTVNSSTYYEGYGVRVGKYSASEAAATSTGVSVREERITFIPPHSAAHMAKLEIKPAGHFDMSKAYKNHDGYMEIDVPYEESNYKVRNYITYSTKEDMSNEKYVDNEFYISNIIQIPKGKFTKEVAESNQWVTKYLFARPDCFFLYLN